MSNLTISDCKKYFGCTVQEESDPSVRGIMKSIDYKGIYVEYKMEAFYNPFSSFQLCLTPLHKIKEEHAIEISKILAGNRYTIKGKPSIEVFDDLTRVWTGARGVAEFRNLLEWRDSFLGISASYFKLKEAIDTARELGYDLDEMIKQNKAVEL